MTRRITERGCPAPIDFMAALDAVGELARRELLMSVSCVTV